MRFVIFGTGAVGGVLAGALVESGADVVAVARGLQFETLKTGDLTLHTPHRSFSVPVPVVSDPNQIVFADEDVILLTVKSQDTRSAMTSLLSVAEPTIPVVAVQNGVANERTLSRVFRNVYGAVVMMPTTFVEPGQVSVYGDPRYGTIDIGRYPGGSDTLATKIATYLTAANFDSRAIADIMRWKYGKLVGNLTNSIEAVCGLGTRGGELGKLIGIEGRDVLEAAGIDYISEEEEDRRRSGNVELSDAGGVARQGASSWQSLARGSGSIETDYLNGEIGLLGRLHGIPTPANDLIQELANRVARSKSAPGSITEEEVLAMLERRR